MRKWRHLCFSAHLKNRRSFRDGWQVIFLLTGAEMHPSHTRKLALAPLIKRRRAPPHKAPVKHLIGRVFRIELCSCSGRSFCCRPADQCLVWPPHFCWSCRYVGGRRGQRSSWFARCSKNYGFRALSHVQTESKIMNRNSGRTADKHYCVS